MVSIPAKRSIERDDLPAALRLMTYGEVAELCGCSQITVRRWVKGGRLRVTRLAQNRARIREDELMRFLETATR